MWSAPAKDTIEYEIGSEYGIYWEFNLLKSLTCRGCDETLTIWKNVREKCNGF